MVLWRQNQDIVKIFSGIADMTGRIYPLPELPRQTRDQHRFLKKAVMANRGDILTMGPAACGRRGWPVVRRLARTGMHSVWYPRLPAYSVPSNRNPGDSGPAVSSNHSAIIPSNRSPGNSGPTVPSSRGLRIRPCVGVLLLIRPNFATVDGHDLNAIDVAGSPAPVLWSEHQPFGWYLRLGARFSP